MCQKSLKNRKKTIYLGFASITDIAINARVLKCWVGKDAWTVKSGFKPVPPQLYFEFASFFLAQQVQKKSGKFKIKLWRNWFESRFYHASIFTESELCKIWNFCGDLPKFFRPTEIFLPSNEIKKIKNAVQR